MVTKQEDGKINTGQLKTTPTHTKNIINCFAPVFTFENIFGIFRFRVLNGHIMPANGWMKVFGLFITSATVIIFVLAYDFPRALSGLLEIVDTIEDVPAIVILFQYATSTVMTSCLLSKANVRIMTSLADLDATLQIKAKGKIYEKSRNHTIIALAVITIVHIISSACDFLLETTDDDSSVIKICNYILNFVQDLEILVFYLMIVMLKSRLKFINYCLVKLNQKKYDQDKITLYTISQKKVKTGKKLDLHGNAQISSSLQDLSTAYDTIGNICHLINKVYNFQVFMTLISAFVYIVIALWTSMYYFRSKIYAGNLITIVLWCFSEMLTVASMAFVCETLLSTRDETKVLVNELVMDYGLPAGARAQAKAFMQLVDAWPLRIFVYDMFSVDITLMLKFISVSTTYLIVIIQISHFA